MAKLGVLAGLLVMAAFGVIGFAPLFECSHPDADQHWCLLIARLKTAVARQTPWADPGPFFGCLNCRDEGRVTLARKLCGPPRCPCFR